MAEHTITLFQYNQKQATKNKATKPNLKLDASDCFPITRKVLGKGMVTFLVPKVLTPGLGSRLVDMMKWNIEVDGKFHRGEAGHTPEKYGTEDFERAVWSLAKVYPVEVGVA